MKKLLILFSFIGFSQTDNLKTWADKDDFRPSKVEITNNQFRQTEDYVEPVSLNDLKNIFLDKKVKPIQINKEFREYYYKNFFKDRALKRKIKNKKGKGFKQSSSNGSFGTLVYYTNRSNWKTLIDKVFFVKRILPISNNKSLEVTDDNNFVFELHNDDLGKIFYKYNVKFKDYVEIELVK